MASLSKVLLSGCTQGKPIKVAATATLGTVIHTATSGTVNMDEIWLYVTNTSGSAVNLTLEWGGATDPDCLVCKTISIPALSGPTPIIPGLLLQNSLVVTAFAGTANVLLISGFVNRFA